MGHKVAGEAGLCYLASMSWIHTEMWIQGLSNTALEYLYSYAIVFIVLLG